MAIGSVVGNVNVSVNVTTHAEVCPLCHGTGRLDTPEGGTRACHGCEGKGWVVVPGVGVGQQPVYYPVYQPTVVPFPFNPYPFPDYRPGEIIVTCKCSSQTVGDTWKDVSRPQ